MMTDPKKRTDRTTRKATAGRGAEGAAGRPVRADPTATHRRGDDLPPVRRVPFPHKGFACTRRWRPAPDRGG